VIASILSELMCTQDSTQLVCSPGMNSRKIIETNTAAFQQYAARAILANDST
jgi:hypothetical protein